MIVWFMNKKATSIAIIHLLDHAVVRDNRIAFLCSSLAVRADPLGVELKVPSKCQTCKALAAPMTFLLSLCLMFALWSCKVHWLLSMWVICTKFTLSVHGFLLNQMNIKLQLGSFHSRGPIAWDRPNGKIWQDIIYPYIILQKFMWATHYLFLTVKTLFCMPTAFRYTAMTDSRYTKLWARIV